MKMNRGEVTFNAVRDWALRNGFSDGDDGGLIAPYAGGSVVIEFLKQNVRTVFLQGEHRQVVISTHPKNLLIDEFDMLQGAGLFSSFYQRHLDVASDLPVWFSEALKKELENSGAGLKC